jgi:phosphoribosylformylglycinamidine synthase PurS subunit
MKYAGIVTIMLREDLLDPAGKAVIGSLQQLGFSSVENVRVGKQVKVVIEADGPDTALAQLEEMCKKLLVNPVTEDYDTMLMALPDES